MYTTISLCNIIEIWVLIKSSHFVMFHLNSIRTDKPISIYCSIWRHVLIGLEATFCLCDVHKGGYIWYMSFRSSHFVIIPLNRIRTDKPISIYCLIRRHVLIVLEETFCHFCRNVFHFLFILYYHIDSQKTNPNSLRHDKWRN